jgi:hypothetical protein
MQFLNSFFSAAFCHSAQWHEILHHKVNMTKPLSSLPMPKLPVSTPQKRNAKTLSKFACQPQE